MDEDRKGPLNGLIFAVNMLVNTEAGNTYSFEEIAGWLTEADFKIRVNCPGLVLRH